MLIACFCGFLMSFLSFSVLEKDHVDQKQSYHSNWACCFGKMVAMAARKYIASFRFTFCFSWESKIYGVHKEWLILLPPHLLHPQKWAINPLLKNNRIRKYATKLIRPPSPYSADIINVWFQYQFFLITFAKSKLENNVAVKENFC